MTEPAVSAPRTEAIIARAALYDSGDGLLLDGSRPLPLDAPDQVYLVTDGRIDLFVVGGGSRRRHLFRLEAGTIFLGGTSTDGQVYLAIGSGETRVRRLDLGILRGQARTDGWPDAIATMLEPWVEGMCTLLAQGAPPRAVQRAGTDAAHLEPGEAIVTRTGLAWLAVRSGQIVLADRTDLESLGTDRAAPVGEAFWLRAIEACELEPIAAADLIRQDALWSEMFALQTSVMRSLASEASAVETAERQGLEALITEDRNALEASEAQIAGVMNQGANLETASTGQPLLDACILVGGATGIDLVSALGLIDHDGPITVRDVARLGHFRTREIALLAGWWRGDCGPILAWNGKERRPVALLYAANSYAIHDPQTRRVATLTPALADELSPRGVVFYPSLPAHSLTWRNLLTFGVDGSGRDLLLLAGAGVVTALLGLALPIVGERIFDDAVPRGDRTELLGLGAVLVAVTIAAALFTVLRGMATLRLESRFDSRVQTAVWDRLISLPASFFRDYGTADLASRALAVNSMRDLLSGAVSNVLPAGLFSVVNLGLLLYYSPPLAAVALLLVLIVVAVVFTVGARQLPLQRRIQTIQGQVAVLVLNLIHGLPTIRIAAAENRALLRWATRFAEQRRLVYRSRRVQSLLTTFNGAYPLLSTLVLFAAVAAQGGGLPVGVFIAVNVAFAQLLFGALQVSASATTLMSVGPLYQRLQPILHTVAEVDISRVSPGELSGEIELNRVSFRYAEDGPLILDNLSLHVSPGEYVALVGPSGSGKSTLFRLLLGFEEPASGGIYYDHHDLRTVDAVAVRRQIGTVIQLGALVSGSILSNIIGSSLLTIEDAWQAAEMAGIADDLRRLPMGLHTMVGDGGGTFSGGQRQRLLIARAIAHRPRIILFDEATSALDNISQEIVSRSLDGLHATRIVIAHRLSTIMHADRIVVVQGGHIVQSGTYQELLAQPGLFAELAHRQMA